MNLANLSMRCPSPSPPLSHSFAQLVVCVYVCVRACMSVYVCVLRM